MYYFTMTFFVVPLHSFFRYNGDTSLRQTCVVVTLNIMFFPPYKVEKGWKIKT